eukprot:TRINITY_DN471_c0_g1_i13.p2 TRINITY_DN471_c0_g1~~TRINITY_DN471_c0_g1_i13.p2  ORF type:complete len:164 (+),score=21.38 TRINITY_DN471_c0_g1_i13:1099-1590(+)
MEVQDTTQQRESYQAIFDAADTDGDGFLNPLDVYVSLTEFGFRHSDSLVNRVVDIYGKKCDDKFDFYTWLQVLVDLGAALDLAEQRRLGELSNAAHVSAGTVQRRGSSPYLEAIHRSGEIGLRSVTDAVTLRKSSVHGSLAAHPYQEHLQSAIAKPPTHNSVP